MTITAELRGAELYTQHLIVFLCEAEDEAGAARLAAAVVPTPAPDCVAITASRGRAVCVLITGSFVIGTPNIETSESVERFRVPVEQALALV